jgi:hypothetical protein
VNKHLTNKHKSTFLIFQLSHKKEVICMCRSKEELGEKDCAYPQVWVTDYQSAHLQIVGDEECVEGAVILLPKYTRISKGEIWIGP